MSDNICACDVCGITSDNRRIIQSKKYGKKLCSKHYYQLMQNNKILDISPMSRFDKNTYRIIDDVVYMDIRNNRQEIIYVTMFDKKFLDDVISRKWRITSSFDYPYVAAFSAPDEPCRQITLHRYIAKLSGLDIINNEIDHKNGNTLDNRLCNLREANRIQQRSNSKPRKNNHYGVLGIGFDKRYDKYSVDFCHNGYNIYFKYFDTIQEAVYIRYLSEKQFYDDVSLQRHLPSMQPYIDQLSEQQKEALEQYFDLIIERNKTRCAAT